MYSISPQKRRLIEEAARLEPLVVVARRFKVNRKTLYNWGMKARGHVEPEKIQWSSSEEIQLAAWDDTIDELQWDNDRLRTLIAVEKTRSKKGKR